MSENEALAWALILLVLVGAVVGYALNVLARAASWGPPAAVAVAALLLTAAYFLFLHAVKDKP